MKKLFVAFALTLFVGSVTTTAYAAVNGEKTEVKGDKEKKKKKKSCTETKEAEAKTCGTSTTQKSCCSKK